MRTSRLTSPAVSSGADNKLAISVDDATALTGLGRSTIYELMTTGQLPFVKLGARRLILVDDIRALLTAHRSAVAA
jgi:excisionase family DNA binding protein